MYDEYCCTDPDDCTCEPEERVPTDLTKLKKVELIEIIEESVRVIQAEKAKSHRFNILRIRAVDDHQGAAQLAADRLQEITMLTERVANLRAALYIAAGEAVT